MQCAQQALALSWRSSTKVLIHIGDYPCHGRQYHDYTSSACDAHMDGDPFGAVKRKALFLIMNIRCPRSACLA